LLENEALRQTMSRNALTRARNEFSDRTMVARIIAFYQEALTR
jgi:glycosyltransferase involved in cell wall biosynthesis